MVHTHLTHDEPFLERFAPHIKPLYRTVASDVPESLAAELRDDFQAPRAGRPGESRRSLGR